MTDPNPAPTQTTGCPICSAGDRRRVLDQTLLGRHEVAYYLCDGCGLLQTEAPYWLEEAYARPIADTDTGILVRNLANARLLNVLLQRAFDADGRFVDIAGGYGLLTRLLRDRGFDSWRSDKYCTNLFADGFEASETLPAQALFAFEVMEHVPDPVAFLTEQFEQHGCRTLVFSTQTYGAVVPAADWWYYSPETGQHISFYQPRTLAALAHRLGCTYTPIDEQCHVFSPEPLPALLRTLMQRRRPRNWLESWMWARSRRRSLTWDDHHEAKRRLQSAFAEARPPSP